MNVKEPDTAIRPLTITDSDLLFDYFNSFTDRTRHFFTPHRLDREYAAYLATEDIHNPDTRRYVATRRVNDGEIIIGYFFFWEWLKKIPWFGIGVRDGYHGQRLGSRMMSYAVEEATAHNKGGILLITKKDNIPAQKLYEKYGYQIIGVEPSGQYLLVLNFPDVAAQADPQNPNEPGGVNL